MKFGTLTSIGPLPGIVRKNFEFLKIQDGGGRHLQNHKNRDIAYSRIYVHFQQHLYCACTETVIYFEVKYGKSTSSRTSAIRHLGHLEQIT